jgi:hypothetical protein
MEGEVMGKRGPRGPIEFDGFIGAEERKDLIFDKILDIPTNARLDAATPLMSGELIYGVAYWIEETPAIKRETIKHLAFDVWKPFDSQPPADGSGVRTTSFETTVRFIDENEQ